MELGSFRRRWLLPLVLFQAYLTLTVVLFFWGPWQWELKDPLMLGGYLLFAQACIAVGFLAAWPRMELLFAQQPRQELGEELGLRVLLVAVAVTLLLLVPTSLARTGALLPDALGGLRDPGLAYNESQMRMNEGGPYVWVEYLRILVAPLLLAVFPLTVVYWRRIRVGMRIACLVAIGTSLAMYLATGTNKGLADFVITLPWLIYLAVFSMERRTRINWWAVGGASLLLLVGFLQFFGAGQLQREGGEAELGVFQPGDGLGVYWADQHHPVSEMLPERERVIFESLTRYLGQGYYALSMSFDLESGRTFGLGHSMFLARNADAVFGTDRFTTASLPAMLEERTGWSNGGLWHSIYPWLASDVGFLGVPPLLGVFAFLLALAWGRALLTKDPWWIVFLHLMLILFFYIPANNQVFQTGESCAGFFLLAAILAWRAARANQERVPEWKQAAT